MTLKLKKNGCSECENALMEMGNLYKNRKMFDLFENLHMVINLFSMPNYYVEFILRTRLVSFYVSTKILSFLILN